MDDLLKSAVTRFGERICWYPKQAKFYFYVREEKWIDPGTEKMLRGHMNTARFFNEVPPESEAVSKQQFRDACDRLYNRFLQWAQIHTVIHWEGELGGRVAGLHNLNGYRILVPRGARIIQGVEGDCSFILRILDALFPGTQKDRVLSWLLHAYRGLKAQKANTGQVLIVAGEPGCGKSLFQKRVVTPVLGGRAAKADKWLAGETGFNGELGSADHWMIDDRVETTSYSRRAFADRCKEFVADPIKRVEAKGRDAVNVELMNRMSIMINTEGRTMALLPEMTKDIAGKIIGVKASHVDFLSPDQEENNQLIASQLPAFIHWLENVYQENPAVICDTRFHTQPFFHPDLKRMVDESSPALQLLPLLRTVTTHDMSGEFVGTSSEIFSQIAQNPSDFRILQTVCKSADSLGRRLSELSETFPEVVLKKSSKRGSVYTLRFPMGLQSPTATLQTAEV